MSETQEGVYVCMSIQYKYRQISSGAGATRRVDAPNVRDTTAGRRAGGRACVCVYVYTVQVQTDLFLGHSARLSYERTSRTRATRDVYDDAPDDEDGV